jgi:hypothetical protein
MVITISHKETSKARKHGLNVYPLEAYGFLIGSTSPKVVHAALPVGKTTHWYDTSDRYAGLVDALEPATDFARSHQLSILGVYHTSAEGMGSEENPIADVPPRHRDGLVLITPTYAGESIWAHQLYEYASHGSWQECGFQKGRRSLDPRLNPRRLMRGWRKVWGPVDYSNNHETELKRLHGD